MYAMTLTAAGLSALSNWIPGSVDVNRPYEGIEPSQAAWGRPSPCAVQGCAELGYVVDNLLRKANFKASSSSRGRPEAEGRVRVRVCWSSRVRLRGG